jgi:hypothetical protein
LLLLVLPTCVRFPSPPHVHVDPLLLCVILLIVEPLNKITERWRGLNKWNKMSG